MNRIWAIIERDLRRFRRSPTLVIVSMVMPLVQLVVLGYAFGGKVKHLEIGVLDQDQGMPAIKVREMAQAVAVNAQTFDTTYYHDQATALRDLRHGIINGLLNIPPNFSRKVLAGDNPRIALIEDNTDQFAVSALEGSIDQMLEAYNQPIVPARLSANATLSVVEVYPYVPYIQYLLPGTIVLAIFVSAMIGGGIIFIDDKARGLHEGYLVTPIRKLELIVGFNLAGAAKAVLTGLVLVIFGSMIAGLPDPLNPARMARMMVLVVVTALALISMMFLLMVRVTDPLVPRAIFGVLNTVLFFPSGAVYPTQAFPPWMKVISKVDPFTYAVHGFKQLALKNTGLDVIVVDLAYLITFTIISMAAATFLFRRTL
ncbi:MAG TPA: ABC transporter permease [Candidatus Baltobacteraceae bacterium]|jgi:ABC-2 type transport system permease protein|nr:ABC transporter permease [Candidatus Baltobacteraceae bacterium]